MMTNVKVEDTVWFKENWSECLTSGVVKSVGMTEITERNPVAVPYATIKSNFADYDILFENLYPTKDALKQAMKKESDERVAAIKAKIHDVNELIAFMYDATISSGAEEYTDWDARRAVKEIAKELLNIDLND